MKRSMNPLYHGARLGTAGELNSFLRWLAAAIYVVALSEIIILGNGLRLINLRKAWRKEYVDKFGTSSRCTTHVVGM